MHNIPDINNVVTGTLNDFKLGDIFDLEEIQRMQDVFSDAAGVASVIIHPDGIPITRPSNFCRLYHDIILKTEKGLFTYYHYDLLPGSIGRPGSFVEPGVEEGLLNGYATISAGDKNIACWLFGQVLSGAADYGPIMLYADEIGADRDEFTVALNEVPVMSPEQFVKISKMVVLLANELSEKANFKLQLNRQSAESEYFIKESQIAAHIGYYKTDFITGLWESSEVLDLIFGIDGNYSRNVNGWLEIVHPDDRQMMDNYLRNEVISLGHPFNKEYRIIRQSDKEVRWVNGMGKVAFNSEGNVLSLVGTIQDITDRRSVQEMLKASEEKYRLIFEYSPLGLLSFDMNGIIIACNESFAKIIGTTTERLAGLNMLDLPDKKLVAAIQKSLDGNVGVYEDMYQSVTANKATPVRALFAPIEVGSRNFRGGVGIIEDNTERKMAEEELKERKEKYRGLSEAAFESIFLSEKGICIEQNQTAERTFGYSSAEAIGRYGTDWIVPDDRPMVMSNMLRGFEEPYEAIALKKDGTTFPCMLRGKMMHYKGRDVRVTSLTDISELKQAENAIRASEEKYRFLFANNPQPMWIYDLETLVFLEVNDAAIDHYGYSREEFLSMTLLDIRLPEDIPMFLQDIVLARSTYNPIGESRHIRKNGETILVEITAHSVTYNGRPARHLLVQDITARKNTEKEILKLNADLDRRVIQRTADLEAANKELESFSYSVSHDLKTPLRHISGFIGLLLENNSIDLSEAELGYLEKITGSAKQMEVLIDALLSFSRLNQAEFRKTRIHSTEMVQQVIRFFEPDLQNRKITFHLESLPEVDGDEALIRQVWTNLISNAIKYTGKKNAAIVEIGSLSEDHGTTFYVKDNGAGFNMTYAKKLFGVFQRLHKSRDFEGIGIGLANVNRIVNRHGGRCHATGEPEQGATFYFSIPN